MEYSKIKFFSWILIAISFLTTAAYFSPHLTFGHGLGDLFNLIIAVIYFLLNTTFVLLNLSKTKTEKKLNNRFLILVVIHTAFTLYYIYALSYGRGPEHSWNGELFI